MLSSICLELTTLIHHQQRLSDDIQISAENFLFPVIFRIHCSVHVWPYRIPASASEVPTSWRYINQFIIIIIIIITIITIIISMIKHNATEAPSADVLTACIGNLLYRVSHKMISCAVLLESFKNFETFIRKQRALGKILTYHKLRQTDVNEVNHWSTVANKTANINVQNRSLYAS